LQLKHILGDGRIPEILSCSNVLLKQP